MATTKARPRRGDGTMQGATFAIKMHQRTPSWSEASHTSRARTWPPSPPADGVAQTASDLLPYGTYELRETVPAGGLPALRRSMALRDPRGRRGRRGYHRAVDRQPGDPAAASRRRSSTIRAKRPYRRDPPASKGPFSPSKSVSANPVLVDGIVYEPGKDVATITSGRRRGADRERPSALRHLRAAPKPSRRRATCSPTKYGASRSARTARLWRRPPSRPSTTR